MSRHDDESEPVATPRKVARRDEEPRSTTFDPRNGVLLVLALVIGLGGGDRLRRWWQARRAIRRLEELDVTADAIRAAARFGRPGLMELFRLLDQGKTPEIRHAAGESLAVLWAGNDLISEEEKAIVVRGFAVDWTARRRYPRDLTVPIPFAVSYGLPFLGIDGPVLEWSHRIAGARRANLEEASLWIPASGRAEFLIEPGDFAANGPHRLVLQARARPASKAADAWELDLPHVPFSFEFDPLLKLEAILASPDAARAAAFGTAIRWKARQESNNLPLNERFVVRNPPVLAIDSSIPCDLAHTLELEFDGIAGRYPAGEVVTAADQAAGRSWPIAEPAWKGGVPIESPGSYRWRGVLTPDPQVGWASSAIRSVWPERIVTDWAEVEVLRR